MTPNSALKKYFGYDSFKEGQLELIQHILDGQDVLGIMPTSAGKSICFQIPALLSEGTVIVISPLISLMKDQVDSLNATGIKAAYLNSTLDHYEQMETMNNAIAGIYKLLYIAPEKLDTEDFVRILPKIPVSFVAVDEAHCVSHWGHDFRPSYINIRACLASLPKKPTIAAFTATATPVVQEDIINVLRLDTPFVKITGFDRPNLYFRVEKPAHKFEFLREILNESEKNKESVIIYASTKKHTDSICEQLNHLGFRVVKYHAGLKDSERFNNQDDFLYDRANIMVATNAFGMGIDKSNVRYVIHYNMPKDLESYYQEAGRAGRDGLDSQCILLFGASDIVTNKFLIEQGNGENNKSSMYTKLKQITDYCNTGKCLRWYMLNYFGEEAKEDCGSCGNCNSQIDKIDMTVDAQKIFSCMKRTGENFGQAFVADILKGSNTARIRSMGLQNQSTYGIMAEYPINSIKEMISFLVAEGYLVSVGDKYPIVKLTAKAVGVLKSMEKVFINKKISKDNRPANKSKITDNVQTDDVLFQALRSLRMEIAKEENLPPYIIFPDKTLIEMARYYPTTISEMLEISGVGQAKSEKYGKRFLKVIIDYKEENQITVTVGPKQLPKQLPKQRLTVNTYEVTYDCFKAGKTVEEIANERQLTKDSILNHLFKLYKEGREINIESFFHKEYEELIVEALQENGYEKLRPIKDILPEEVTYVDISFCIYKYFSE